MRQVSLRLPEDLLAKVDQARGTVPRDRWLRMLVEQHFAIAETHQTLRVEHDGTFLPIEPVTGRILR